MEEEFESSKRGTASSVLRLSGLAIYIVLNTTPVVQFTPATDGDGTLGVSAIASRHAPLTS